MRRLYGALPHAPTMGKGIYASGDGEVNAIDLNLMRRHLVGLYKANTSVIDINADDNVNAIDLNLMRRMLVGLYKPEK